MSELNDTKKFKASNGLSLLFLGLASLSNAYSSGFNNATFFNHFLAILTIAALVNLIMKLEE